MYSRLEGCVLSVGGLYVMVTSSRSSGGQALLISPPVSGVPGERRCLEFWWTSGSTVSDLSVRVLRHDGVLGDVAWNQSSVSPSRAWKQATVDLVVEGPFQACIFTLFQKSAALPRDPH